RRRDYSIDFMRVILFSCVVMVHTVGTINQGPDIARQMWLLSLLMHYTRYGFVFVTVYVLFLGYYRKDTRPVTFWRRRFGLVVLPYLVWSVTYSVWNPLVVSQNGWPGIGNVARDTVLQILKGDAKYQMYFLLISMQLYFFFPVLRWVVKRTEGHHGKLFAAGAVIQVAMMIWLTVLPAPDGFLGLVHRHAWKFLPTYALLITIGALAAVHQKRAHAWFTNHVRLLTPLIVLGTAITVGVYWYQTGHGVRPANAASAAYPTLLPWVLASIVGLYLIAAKWNKRRGDGSGIVAKIVDLGSVRAFGVFAAHPLVIDTLLQLGLGDWLETHIPGSTLVRSLLLVAATFAVTIALVEVLLRTPVSKALVARSPLPFRAKPKPTPAETSAA
ncbi:MAG: acyltransferase, partial [Sciscionella sp.]